MEKAIFKKPIFWIIIVLIIVLVIFAFWYFLWYSNETRVGNRVLKDKEYQFVLKQLQSAPTCSQDNKCKYWGWINECGSDNEEMQKRDLEESGKAVRSVQEALGNKASVDQGLLLGGDCLCYKDRCVLVPYDEPSIGLLEQYIKK